MTKTPKYGDWTVRYDHEEHSFYCYNLKTKLDANFPDGKTRFFSLRGSADNLKQVLNEG